MLIPAAEDSALQIGVHAFTKAGHEIIELFLDEKYTPVEGYFEEVCEYWGNHGWQVTEVFD